MTTPAMRLKTHWFRAETAKTPEQLAGAMAFITWRVAVQMLKRMRDARFDIDAGVPYFAFVREVLVFLLAVIDRMAYARLGAEHRVPFVTELVLRVAGHLQDNAGDLLGTPTGQDWRDQFIDQFNELSQHYAEFGWSAEQGPDFAFVRYLGSRLETAVPDKDKRWVIDQVMAIEAPEALASVQRGMDGVFSTEPRARRRGGMTGE
jgi:hypothetical protein